MRGAILQASSRGKMNPNGDKDPFLRVVGECVSLWANLDRGLFDLTKAALKTDDLRTAIVFYSWSNISNHLSLVDRLMKNFLSEINLENDWRPLHKKIRLHLDTRSIYAHQPIKRSGTIFSIHIEPAEKILAKKYQGLGDKQELRERDLLKHAKSLVKLVKELSEFHDFFKQKAINRP
jgi:hypothetical protein